MYSNENIVFYHWYFSSLFITTISDVFSVSQQIESNYMSHMFRNLIVQKTSLQIENSRTLHITYRCIYVYSLTVMHNTKSFVSSAIIYA